MKINKIENNNNLSSQGLKNMDNKKITGIADEVKAVTAKLLARAEREVPENLDFSPVREVIKNVGKHLESKEFILKIIADPTDIKNSRRIILSTVIPDTQYSASVTVSHGNKTKLLNEMRDEKFSETVLSLLKEVDDAAINAEIR